MSSELKAERLNMSYPQRWTTLASGAAPRDYARWAELVYQWVNHCIGRYGRAEVEKWYWEVWNEPDGSAYWHGTPEDFYKLNGFAGKRGGTYVASVTDGAARALFELAAAVWANPQFRADVGHTSSLPPPADPEALVPRGLDYTASVALIGVEEAEALHNTPHRLEWSRPYLASLSGVRKYAFERTFSEGMRFLFMHELAHVCLGHLDVASAGQPFDCVS
jgi:hypothetical protein